MRLFSRRTATWMAGSALILSALAFVADRANTFNHSMQLTSGIDFSISGTVSGLTPGSNSNLQLTVTNPKSVAITVKTLSVSLGTPLPSGCDASYLDLSAAQYTSQAGFNVAPNGGTANAPDLTVRLIDAAAANQDGCKNVTFPLSYTGTAAYTQVFATTTSLTSSVNPSVLGQAVTFTASVAAGVPQQGTGSAPSGPTGKVTFRDGASVLGTVALAANGSAQFPTSALTAGTHSITAEFSNTPVSGSPDGNFSPSTSSPLSQVVNSPKKTSATTVTSSLNPSTAGQSVTLTASVTPQATGTVTFYDNGTPLGTPQTLVRGVATLTTSSLSTGTHPITAAYSGDATFHPSTSAALAQVVNAKASSATAVTSSLNPSVFGGPVTFTAKVTSGSGTPTGSVRFSSGSTTLGTGVLNNKGVATFTTSALTPPTSTVNATYAGDANLSGSSAALNQTVNRATPTVGLSSNNNPAKAGASVTFTVTVMGVPQAAPTGSVTLSIDGTAVATLALSGPRTFTTSSLSVGTHTVTAAYQGDTNYATGSASLTQKVGK